MKTDWKVGDLVEGLPSFGWKRGGEGEKGIIVGFDDGHYPYVRWFHCMEHEPMSTEHSVLKWIGHAEGVGDAD